MMSVFVIVLMAVSIAQAIAIWVLDSNYRVLKEKLRAAEGGPPYPFRVDSSKCLDFNGAILSKDSCALALTHLIENGGELLLRNVETGSVFGQQELFKLIDMLKQPTSMTAGQIANEIPPRRLRLRKSLSELASEQEGAHRTQEAKHLDIVRNMETVGIRDAAMRQKE